jgi:hypothetical protein
MIVSIVSIVACLVLATRGAPFRGIGTARTVRYALIWAAIIIGLVLFLQVSGLRLGA